MTLGRSGGTAAMAAFVCALALPVGAGAQDSSGSREPVPRATFIGTVVSAVTGLPVEGATVIMALSGMGAITTEDGTFRIPVTPAGHDTVEVRRIGFEPARLAIDLVADETNRATFLLSDSYIRLQELVVEARQTRADRNLSGLEQRMELGQGTFFLPEQIIRRNPRLPSDLLRGLPGVTVSRIQHNRATVRFRGFSQSNCAPALYLDGVYQAGMEFDDLPRDELGAVEVYRRELEIPGEYIRQSKCGAILVWSPHSPEFLTWARNQAGVTPFR